MSETELELTLFVIGQSGRSVAAIRNARLLCERYLKDRYRLRIVDLLERPDEAEQHRILASPMLLRSSPGPEKRIVGDLSDLERVVQTLELNKTAKNGTVE